MSRVTHLVVAESQLETVTDGKTHAPLKPLLGQECEQVCVWGEGWPGSASRTSALLTHRGHRMST